MYLAYDTPHAVLELPTQAYPEGGGLTGGLQWIGTPGHMLNTSSGTIDSWVHPDYATATYDHDTDTSTPQVPWPKVYQRYATAIRRIDSAVGDLVQLLEDLHIKDNTLIVFTSDNGPSRESYLPKQYQPNEPTFFESYGPFDGIKRDVWEGGIRMPALAVWPGHIPAGSVDEEPSANYDWLATFADAAGVPIPAVSDGVSLLPSLTGQGTQKEGVIYVEYYHPGVTPSYEDFAPEHRGARRNQMQMIRLGDYVGVRYNIQSTQDDFAIYNIPEDPGQEHNLAAGAHTPARIQKLQEKMQARVLQVRMPNPTAPRPYDDALVPAVHDVEVVSGIVWKAFEDEFPWLPKVWPLKPDATGFASRPKVDVDKTEGGVLYFEGYIDVPRDGTYTFSLRTDTSGLLRLHKATVIDAGYGYQPGSVQSGTINLQAGLHPFRLYYRHKGATDPFLKLKWSGPGISKQPIPASIFFHKK